MSSKQARRYRRFLMAEVDGAAVYRALAERYDGRRGEILGQLAAAEERHAGHWADRLAEVGEQRPDIRALRAGWRARLLILLVRVVGARFVVPLLERGEATEIRRYGLEPSAPDRMVVEERIHARVVASLFPSWRTRLSGSLRAGTFGMNDGLVSNLALVMGVAGGRGGDDAILLAGLAGLLGGGLSMGIGEWISVTTQRELWEGEIELDTRHLESLPQEGANELGLLFQARGTPAGPAAAMAAEVLRSPPAAARLLADEKLGFDPRTLGSPWGAATSNFGAFVAGAAVPVLPYLLGSGAVAFTASIAVSAVALFGVGALLSLLTYRPMVWAGCRQLAIGALAAGATYVLGGLVSTVL